MTVGELASWIGGTGIALLVGAWRLYVHVKNVGIKEGRDKDREDYQLEALEQLAKEKANKEDIDRIVEDYNKLKEDVERLYQDKANKDDVKKVLDRLDSFISLLIQSNNEQHYRR